MSQYTVNEHGTVYRGERTDDTQNVIGWISAYHCDNPTCHEQIREGLLWHATPLYGTLERYHFASRAKAVLALTEHARQVDAEQDFSDVDYVIGAVLAALEDLSPPLRVAVLRDALAQAEDDTNLTDWSDPVPSYVRIPGTFTLEYTPAGDGTGTITGYSFSPSASDAGYFGPAAVLSDGPELNLSEHTETPTPFWSAVRSDLESRSNLIPVLWSE